MQENCYSSKCFRFQSKFFGENDTFLEAGNMNECVFLERYYTFLKEECQDEKVWQYFVASSIGLQLKGNGHWCLSREVGFKYGT